MACQDAGEAIREGGTRTDPADLERKSTRLMGVAWLIVRRKDGPHLLEIWGSFGDPSAWTMHPVVKDSEPDRWVSITFPRQQIEAAAQTLRALASHG